MYENVSKYSGVYVCTGESFVLSTDLYTDFPLLLAIVDM